MRLIDGDKLMEFLDKEVDEMREKGENVKPHHALMKVVQWVKSGEFDAWFDRS